MFLDYVFIILVPEYSKAFVFYSWTTNRALPYLCLQKDNTLTLTLISNFRSMHHDDNGINLLLSADSKLISSLSLWVFLKKGNLFRANDKTSFGNRTRV